MSNDQAKTDGKGFTHSAHIRFSDTDAAGVAHFSRLLCLVEDAEHEFLRRVGVPVMDGTGGWPRASLNAEFLAPCRFGDTVVIRIAPVELGTSSVTWAFRAAVGETPVMKGRYVTVRVDAQGKPRALSEN